MLTAERKFRHSSEIAEPHLDGREGLFFIAWLQNVKKQIENSEPFTSVSNYATELLSSITKRKKFRIWDSQTYFGTGKEAFGEKQNKVHLQDELLTFFDEYAALNPRKKYEEYGTHGRGNRNALPTSQLCEHFTEILEKQEKDTSRANLETWIAQTFESFLNDSQIPAGEIFISISPRGSLHEGYPGLDQKNYVFVNVYVKNETKDETATATLYQFTSYATTHDLTLQHAEMIATLGAQTYQPKLPNEENIKTAEHQLISQPILLHSVSTEKLPQTLHALETILYQNQDNWPTKIEDLPQINMDEYELQSQAITAESLQIFEMLSQLQDSQEISKDQAIAKMDSFVMLSRKYLLKWVEINASNYKTNKKSKQNKPLPTIQELVDSWKEHHFSEKSPDKKSTNTKRMSLVLSSLEVTSKSLLQASSAAHCVLGTPSSLMMQAAKLQSASASVPGAFGPSKMMAFEAFRKGGSFSGGKSPEGRAEIDESSVLFKRFIELKTIQTNLVPITIKNRQTQKDEVVYIWFSDPAYAADYAVGCYRNTSSGKVFGPCDIELEKDDLISSFSFDMSEKKYLDESEYQSLLAHLFELEMQIMFEHFAKQADLENGINSDEKISEKQRAQLSEIVAKLSRRIFRVTLSDLVAGIIDYTDEFLALPQKCISFLNQAGTNKMQALNELILILESEDIQTITNQLAMDQISTLSLIDTAPHDSSSLAA